MIPISSVEQVRALDARAIRGLGIPGPVLMETAGRHAARLLLERLGDAARSGGVLVLAGRGNNGGDGYVLARHLHLRGIRVAVSGSEGRHSEDAELQRRICSEMGIPVDAPVEPERYGVVVDALLGTGLRSAPRAATAERIRRMRESGRPVLAIDVPSGLDADTGEAYEPCVRATLTVTFGRAKRGFFLEPAPDFLGELWVADIGLGAADSWQGRIEGEPETDHCLRMPEPADVAAWLPPAPGGAHKGTFGHLALLAGSAEKTGAAVLAANAAARSGAGLVTLFLPREAWGRLGALRPEVMLEDAPGLEEQLGRFDALVVGPGLGTAPAVVERVRRLWREAGLPAVFDADGLNALAGALEEPGGPRIVTPHPGEAGRLLGRSSREVQADRLGALAELARPGVTALLKGRYSLVSGAPPWVNPTGGPQLATGGSGDVLSGLLGALLAQGLEPGPAAVAGAFLHGYAAELAGSRPLLAGDVLDALPRAFRELGQRGPVLRRLQLP